MKIAVCSYGTEIEHIDGFGGLEHRFAVNWAYFLQREGHEVHFFDPQRGVDNSFDLAIDCLVERCDNIHAKRHIHSGFNPIALTMPGIQDNPCYQADQYLYANPYRVDYLKSLGMRSSQGYKHTPLFMPLPYPDSLLPANMLPGFQRNEISWTNKGNFDPEFGPDSNFHFVLNGIETLKALVKLNQKADFKVTFLLDYLIRETRVEWRGEVESLIAQLKNVERLGRAPWTQLVQLLGRCKLNTHAGGLTSSINEAIFTYGLPVTPVNFIHLATVDLLPDPKEATADKIYDVYERLWLDPKFYWQTHEAFQDHFRDHRTAGVRKAWANLCQQLELE